MGIQMLPGLHNNIHSNVGQARYWKFGCQLGKALDIPMLTGQGTEHWNVDWARHWTFDC